MSTTTEADELAKTLRLAKRRLKHSGLRKWLYARVLEGTPVVLKIQEYRSTLLDNYFKFSTFCGDKLFYITIVPIFFWSGYPSLMKMGRLFTLLLTTSVYIGNFLKELLALPRPPSPPVWRNKQEHDYGLPSAHTMSSLSASMFLISHMIHEGILPLNAITCTGIAFWVLSIAGSRLYLGHHSPADVTAGSLLGFLLTYIWYRFGDNIDSFVLSHPFVPLLLGFLALGLSTIHPRSVDGTPSYARSIAVLGFASGVILGSWTPFRTEPTALTTYLANASKSYLVNLRAWNLFNPLVWKVSVRLLVGFTVINILFFSMVKLYPILFHIIFNLPVVRGITKSVVKFFGKFELPSYEPIAQPEWKGEVKAKNISPQKQEEKKKKSTKKDGETLANIWTKFFSSFGIGYLMVYTMPIFLNLVFAD